MGDDMLGREFWTGTTEPVSMPPPVPYPVLRSCLNTGGSLKSVQIRREGQGDSDSFGKPPALMNGMFVSVRIPNIRASQSLIEIPITALRPGNKVWLLEDGVLRVRTARVAQLSDDRVYLLANESGVGVGDQVIVSPLVLAVDGMHLMDSAAGQGETASAGLEKAAMRRMVMLAINNSPAMNILMVAILVVGTISIMNLRREVFPEFELEIVLVTVPYPGASPSEVEEGICLKVEEAVQAIEGIKKLTSVAQEGAGSVVLELRSDVKDVQKIVSEVRAEVDRIPSFPELAEDPDIRQITIRDPAINVAIMMPQGRELDSLELREVAEMVRDELLSPRGRVSG